MKTFLSESKFKMMPWKNGLGVTAEIAISPPNSSLAAADFEWRLSQATIEGPNSFSKFGGYGRILVVVRGEGLLLNKRPLLPKQILNFDGEESIECELINGVVQDFGLIYRKDRYHVEATHHEIATLTNIPLSEGAHFLRALGGDLIVDGTALAGHDVLQINGAAMLAVEAKAIGVQLLRLSLKAVNM